MRLGGAVQGSGVVAYGAGESSSEEVERWDMVVGCWVCLVL